MIKVLLIKFYFIICYCLIVLIRFYLILITNNFRI